MREIYLDNSATTKAYESVGELVYKVMCEDYGNPSSRHVKGVTAEGYIKEAKEILAKLMKVQEKRFSLLPAEQRAIIWRLWERQEPTDAQEII